MYNKGPIKSIILAQGEELKPGMMVALHAHSKDRDNIMWVAKISALYQTHFTVWWYDGPFLGKYKAMFRGYAQTNPLRGRYQYADTSFIHWGFEPFRQGNFKPKDEKLIRIDDRV